MKANIEKQKKTLKEIELDKCFRWVTLYNFGPPGSGQVSVIWVIYTSPQQISPISSNLFRKTVIFRLSSAEQGAQCLKSQKSLI